MTIFKKNNLMDYLQFNHTLDMAKPPEDFDETLKSLWWDRKGEWEMAHSIIQHIPGTDAAWVHAYLHRKEGDLDNAAYWYHKAGKDIPEYDHIEEFRELTKVFLKDYL